MFGVGCQLKILVILIQNNDIFNVSKQTITYGTIFCIGCKNIKVSKDETFLQNKNNLSTLLFKFSSKHFIDFIHIRFYIIIDTTCI